MDQFGGELQVRPRNEFKSEAGKTRLLSSGLLRDHPQEHQDGHSTHSPEPANDGPAATVTSAAAAEGDAELFSNRMRLSALIHLESMDLTCGAACALLAHLSRFASRDELPGKEASLGIVQIEMLKLDKILQVSAATQRALSIFNEETVANPSSSGQKEGLSLFSLLNWTASTPEKGLLRRWIAYPSADLDVINARHDAVECLLRAQNAGDVTLLANELRNGVNIPALFIGAFVRNQPGLSAWKKLHAVSATCVPVVARTRSLTRSSKFCTHSMAIRGILLGIQQPTAMIDNVSECPLHMPRFRR